MTTTSEVFAGHHPRAWIFPAVAAAEGACLIVGAKGLELLGLDLQSLPINPYLACIILMAAQHGVFGGIFTAAIAIAMTNLSGWAAPMLGQSYFDYMLAAWTSPLVFLATGLGVGMITSRRVRTQARTELALERALRAQGLIEHQYNILATRARKLERNAAGLDDEDGKHRNIRGRKDRDIARHA